MKTVRAVSLYLALLASACGLPQEAEEQVPSTAMSQLMSFTAVGGHEIELYEATPGVILLSEDAPIGEAPVLTDALLRLPVAELVARLKPVDTEVPRALFDAIDRSKRPQADRPDAATRSAQPERAPEAPQSGPTPAGLAAQGIVGTDVSTGTISTSAQAFRDAFCMGNAAYQVATWGWCNVDLVAVNLGLLGTMSAYGGGETYVYVGTSVVASAVGSNTMTVKVREWWSWEVIGAWSVSQGRYRQVTAVGVGLDFDFRSSVKLSLTGKAHHAGWGFFNPTLNY